MDDPKLKTYKRELAALMLLVYGCLLIAGIWKPEATVASETIKLHVFTFVGLAFGLDAYSKQIK